MKRAKEQLEKAEQEEENSAAKKEVEDWMREEAEKKEKGQKAMVFEEDKAEEEARRKKVIELLEKADQNLAAEKKAFEDWKRDRLSGKKRSWLLRKR